MVDTGMKALGYEWVVIDDCWHPTRDANVSLITTYLLAVRQSKLRTASLPRSPFQGTLVPYKDYFPNGIKPVADYVHSLGLKFGLCVHS